MTASLFREEALRRFRRSPLQPPLLSKPVSGLLLAALSALAVVGMVLFAFSFQFARKEQATGYLSPVGGWSRVSVRRPAVVRQRFVEAGDVVEAGDELFELTTGEGFEKGQSVANRILRDIEGRRQALRERLAATDAQYATDAVLLDADRTAAEREAEHLASELRSHEARPAIATRQYARALRLRRSGVIAESGPACRCRRRRVTVGRRHGGLAGAGYRPDQAGDACRAGEAPRTRTRRRAGVGRGPASRARGGRDEDRRRPSIRVPANWWRTKPGAYRCSSRSEPWRSGR